MAGEMPDAVKARTASVLGGGAWGCALALAAARAGLAVTWWMRDEDKARLIHHERRFTFGTGGQTPSLALPPSIHIICAMEKAAANETLLFAVPAQVLRVVATAFSPFIRQEHFVISCAKGIERGTLRFMNAVLRETLQTHDNGARIGALSGPSFAHDVAHDLPTAATLAMGDEAHAEYLAKLMMSAHFRLYHARDVVGVEIGGALKNVLAIAVGVAHGLELGASAKAALIARAFAELQRFGLALGALPATLGGLSGLGDLVLTCSSTQSRNFSYGIALARGLITDGAAAHEREGILVEGRLTAPAIAALASAYQVDMPIICAVHALVEGVLTPKEAMAQLLARPQRSEQ